MCLIERFIKFQLIGGLADEKRRWQESVEKLTQIIDNIINKDFLIKEDITLITRIAKGA